jgi:hypothetical protein
MILFRAIDTAAAPSIARKTINGGSERVRMQEARMQEGGNGSQAAAHRGRQRIAGGTHQDCRATGTNVATVKE